MPYNGRIRHLEAMHAELDKKIDAMEKTGIFEDTNLQSLKKHKLSVLDELRDLRRKQYEESQRMDLGDDR
jgi:hypothetical protein